MAKQPYCVYVLRHDTRFETIGVFRYLISAMLRAETLGLHEKGRGWKTNPERTIYHNNDGEYCEFPLVIEKIELEK